MNHTIKAAGILNRRGESIRPHRLASFAALYLLISLGHVDEANACIVMAKFHMEDIRHTDVVFKGRVIEPEKKSDRTKSSGTVLFEVEQTYFGPERRRWELIGGVPGRELWPYDFYPKSWIVAAMKPGKSLPLRGPSAAIFGRSPSNLYRIAKAPCAQSFLFHDRTQIETRIKIALSLIGDDDTAEKERLLRKYFAFGTRGIRERSGDSKLPMYQFSLRKFDPTTALQSSIDSIMKKFDPAGDGISDLDVRRMGVRLILRRQPNRKKYFFRYFLANGKSMSESEVLDSISDLENHYIVGTFPLQSRKTSLQTYRDVMKADRNDDNILTLEEALDFIHLNGDISNRDREYQKELHRDLRRAIALFDLDKNEVLNRNEIEVALKSAYKFYDRNGDGFIDEE